MVALVLSNHSLEAVKMFHKVLALVVIGFNPHAGRPGDVSTQVGNAETPLGGDHFLLGCWSEDWIDPNLEEKAASGRPFELANKGTVRRELFG